MDSTTSMHFGLPRAKCRVEHTELTLMRVQLRTRRYIDTFKSDGTFSTKAFSCLVEKWDALALHSKLDVELTAKSRRFVVQTRPNANAAAAVASHVSPTNDNKLTQLLLE